MPGGVILADPTGRRPSSIIERDGETIDTGACVTAALADHEVAISAHGDGAVRFFRRGAAPAVVQAHQGVVLSMALDRTAGAVLTGGDDGRFLAIAYDGAVTEIAGFASRWVDHVAASPAGGWRACSVGKVVQLWDPAADRVETFEHPSTVGGLAFHPSGNRLAVAHYGGVTVWEKMKRRWKASGFVWAGSHLDVSWSPGGKFLVTSMQENALHGWRVRDKANMRMAGYPSKIRSMDWVGEPPYLVTGGAEQAVCWPFHAKDGPMGREPLCLADGGEQIVTCVRGLPGQNAFVAGFQDGMVLLSQLSTPESYVARGATGSEVTAIAVLPDLSGLLIGEESGRVLWAPFAPAPH